MQKERGMDVTKGHLFYGLGHQDVDFMYKEQLEAYEKEGLVQLHLACSKNEKKPEYVQDRLWRERAVVWEVIQSAGVIYVCGDGKYMAPAVYAILQKIYKEETNAGDKAAAEWILKMVKDKKYIVDVWA